MTFDATSEPVKILPIRGDESGEHDRRISMAGICSSNACGLFLRALQRRI